MNYEQVVSTDIQSRLAVVPPKRFVDWYCWDAVCYMLDRGVSLKKVVHTLIDTYNLDVNVDTLKCTISTKYRDYRSGRRDFQETTITEALEMIESSCVLTSNAL